MRHRLEDQPLPLISQPGRTRKDGCNQFAAHPGNDNILRPAFDKPEYNELTDTISSLGQMYHNSRALSYGDYTADEAADVLIDGITGVIAQ